MLILDKGKSEMCYFVDAGNKEIRLLRNAHDFDATQTVQKVHFGATASIEPMGLALISRSLIAISEDRVRRVQIAHLDDTHATGLVLSTLTWDGPRDGLVAPCGLAALDGSLFIADKTRVLGVGVASGDGASGRMLAREATSMRRSHTSQLATAPFTDARAVAACNSKDGALLAVTDVGSHLVRLLGLRRFAVMSTRVLGKSGVPGHLTGAIEASTFDEPLALAYANGVLYVSCYGGKDHGVAVALLNACGLQLEAASKARNEAVGFDRGAKGPEGTWPLYEVEAISQTAVSVSCVLDAMEEAGVSLDNVKLSAFANEAGMEGSFAQAPSPAHAVQPPGSAALLPAQAGRSRTLH